MNLFSNFGKDWHQEREKEREREREREKACHGLRDIFTLCQTNFIV